MTVIEVRGVDAVLSSGGLIHIRLATPDDVEGLRRLHRQASDRSLFLRYFTLNRDQGDRYAAELAAEPAERQRTLVACRLGEIVGVASYARLDEGRAEVALLVADADQHQGVGTLLLEHLASLARHEGIARFVAEVLPENGSMIHVFRDLGYVPDLTYEQGDVHVAFRLDVTDRVVAALDEREAVADALSLQPVLAPRSVVVVGASPRPGSIGGKILANILAGGFTGTVYVVHPSRPQVLGVRAYPSAAELPEAPDLAVVAVPAAAVLDVVRACGARGVRGLVLISSGFGETGVSGRARQQEILAVAREHGMRLIGPNCLGIVNTDPAIRLNATFAEMPLTAGHLGLASQSGALGIAVVAAANACGLGTSQFVSMGNKADVSGNDLLMAWEHDDRTRVIGLYLESLGNPRRFARIARRVSRHKPVIAIKSGRSRAGQRAGTSHTAAAAESDVVVDALFTQAGVLRVDSMQQMLDAARVLSDQPLPAGPRVAIVGNSGGPGILAADAAEAAGLTVVELSQATQSLVRQAVPGAASSQNPVDLGAGADADIVRAALTVLLDAGEVDAVMTVFTDTGVSHPQAVLDAVAETAAHSGKPVVMTHVGAAAGSVRPDGVDRALPVFTFPEPAAQALALAHRYARIRSAPAQDSSRPADIDQEAAAAVVRAREGAPGWLDADETAALLSAYGVPLCPHAVVHDEAAARTAAATLGYPLAVKLAGGGTHKSDVGGVRLGIDDEAALLAAYREIASLAGGSASVLLQPMAAPGVEIIVGAVHDDLVGPVVMLGVGGVLSDLLADRTFRLAPLGEVAARQMQDDLRLGRLLDGYRGGPAVSRPALAGLVCRVAQLVADHPEVAELDLNPVIGTAEQLVVVDARVRLADPAPTADPLLRALR